MVLSRERLQKFVTNSLATNFSFLFCLLVFLVGQVYLTYAPIVARSLPTETDDAYSYILKAAQIDSSCFLQNCPALNDLRVQFSEPTSNLGNAFQRNREYQRVFIVYHPLHSLALVLLKYVGFSYEQAYNQIAFAGIAFICLGIAYWLSGIYGKFAACIAFLLLGLVVFQGQGLTAVVPSNIALGISFFIWGVIIRNKAKLFWAIIPSIPAMLLTHSLGIIYGAISLILLCIRVSKPFTKQTKIILVVSLFVISMFLSAQLFVHRPELSTNLSSLYPGKIDYLKNLSAASEVSFRVAGFWFDAFPNIIGVIVIVSLSVLLMPKAVRKSWYVMGSLLFGFLLFAFFYVDPWYGAFLFERAWVPVAIFLTGSIGFAISGILVYIFRAIRAFLKPRINKSGFHPNARELFSVSLALVSLSLIINYAFISYFPYYRLHYDLTLNNKIDRKNYRVNAGQPSLITQDRSDQSIIYSNEFSLYYYLTYGGLKYGAIYSPVLDTKQFNEDWLQNKLANSTYLVAGNPIFNIQSDPGMNINLDDNASLNLRPITPTKINAFQAFIIHNGRPVDLEITWQSTESILITNKTIPDKTNGWIDFSQNQINAEEFTVRVIGNRSIILHGLRLDDKTQTNWPWNPGVILTLIPERGDAVSARISNSELAGVLPISLEVIDDEGITVLAKVVK
jgi:hypothetical protein